MDADKNRQVQSPANDTAASLSSPAALTKNDKGIYTSSEQLYAPPVANNVYDENTASRVQESNDPVPLTQIETRKPAPQVAVESINNTASMEEQKSGTVTANSFGKIDTVKQDNDGQERSESNRSVVTNQQTD